MNGVKICETTISKTRPFIEVPIGIIAKVGDDFLMNVEIDPKNQNYPNKSIQTEEDWYNERAGEQYI